MFAYLFRGRKNPPSFHYLLSDGPIRPDEARFAAWALALGGTRPPRQPRYPPRRIHRGILPDVDFGNAVPAPARPSPLRRLIAAVRSRRSAAKAAPLPAPEPSAHGETGYGRGAFGITEMPDAFHISRRAA